MARYISTPSRATGFANRCVYSTPGSYTFTVPDGVTSIKAIAVGGGAPGSTGFVDDYSEVSQIACPGWKSYCATSDACLSGYRCYGYGFCAHLCLNSYVKRSPYLLNKFAFGYTGSGGGYSEKTIAVTPGDSFCATVGDQEETSSFFGSVGCISATGASSPTIVRTSAPCKYGWSRVDANGDTTTVPPSFCISECEVCTPAQSSTTEWRTKWCLHETNNNGTCYKYSETLDCPVLCLTSIPGCGVGGDVNYTGGPSKTFSVKTLATAEFEYGCPSSKENCQCYWATTTCNAISISSHNWGSHSCTNCSSGAWDHIINGYSTYDDIENDCIGGACAAKLSARESSSCSLTNCLWCSAQHLSFYFRSSYDNWEGYCCCCYFGGYKMPAFKQFSADKQFLEANQGGASSGSPLGNGCTGGVGCTLFGAETDQLVCQNNQLCSTELTNCSEQWSQFFTEKPWIYCNDECGYQSFNYYTCCPSVAFFDRYTSPYKNLTKAEFQKEYNPVLNLNCDETIMNPSFTLFPWRDKAGVTDTCTNEQCCQKWWQGDCYWSCSGARGYETANGLAQVFSISMCFTCCPANCEGSRLSLKPMGKSYDCPKRYNCSSNDSLELWIRPQCYSCNCCCSSCYNNCCLTGTSTNWVDAVRNQCLIRENTTVDDVIDYQTAGMPWVKDYWNCFKYCAESETASDDHKKSWCVMCGMWNAMLYHMAYADCCKPIYNHYCNCQGTGCFEICKTFYNYSCYRPSSVCYGMQCSCHEFRCSGSVKSKIISAIDSESATIIPGSAGGPNAEGQSGYVLGDEEILIAGTGADKSGSTQPQYILTSSGASMSKATFDKIRSSYNGDLMAWYLNECWKPICTTYATGGSACCNYGTVLSLEGFECCSPAHQGLVSSSHYLGTCCNNCCLGGGTYCLNSSCGSGTSTSYGMKLYACANAEFIRKFNLHTEYSKYAANSGTSSGCERTFIVVDVGSSGGIVIAPKSKAFSGDPLCINTGGGSSTTSYAVGEIGTSAGQHTTNMQCLRWSCCGSCTGGMSPYNYSDNLTACVDESVSCKYIAKWSCMASCSWGLPYFKFTNQSGARGPYHGGSRAYTETSREVGGGGGDIFINEKYTGSTLPDDYLFSSTDPVFGGTGQICVNGSTLYSLPGLTQGGSVGGCIVKGNETQSVTQTAYSGGIFPKGTPGFGGGGTVCGEGGSGLIVIYWN